MALYRFEAKIIGRSGGKSTLSAAAYRSGQTATTRTATSAAAYRHGSVITDERTGVTYDYTRKRGVGGGEILAPDNAPGWASERERLWNEVEHVERRKDSQLARDFVISFPHELDQTQRRDMLVDFLGRKFVDRGYVCDIAYHLPHGKGDDRNHHAHVMVPTRTVDQDGFSRNKERPDGNPVGAWKEELAGLREDWATTMNRHLEAAGRSERVSHLSLVDRGIDRMPEPKQGPLATQIEREGRESNAGNDRRRVQAENAEREAIRAEISSVVNMAVEAMKRGKMNEPNEELTGQQPKREGEALEQMRGQEQEVIDSKKAKSAQADEAKFQGKMGEPEQELTEQQPKREAKSLADMQDQEERINAFKKARQAEAEEAKKHEQANEEQQKRGWQEGDISDAATRYSVALGRCYNIKDPYTSLAEAAAVEGAAFATEQQNLRREAAAEKDAEKRHEIELRRRIEACEYMSITSTRLSGISATIAGREDAPQAVLDRERASVYDEMASNFRDERAQLQADRDKREAAAEREGPPRDGGEKDEGDRGAEVTDAEAEKYSRMEAEGHAHEQHERDQDQEAEQSYG